MRIHIRLGTRVLIAFGMSFLLLGKSIGQVTQEEKSISAVQKQVLKVEESRDRALQRRDVAVLNRIYSDQLVFVNTRGQSFTKADRLAVSAAGKVEYFSYRQGNYKFHVYGDTVIMTGTTSSIVKFQGRVNRIPRHFTNVYVRLGGQWRLVAHQATPMTQQ